MIKNPTIDQLKAAGWTVEQWKLWDKRTNELREDVWTITIPAGYEEGMNFPYSFAYGGLATADDAWAEVLIDHPYLFPDNEVKS